MNTLQQARDLIRGAESAYQTSEERDGNAYYRGLSERRYSEAAIYAAVAQAEALTRLADAAELLLKALSALARSDAVNGPRR